MRRRRGGRLAGGCRYWVARAVGVVTLIALTAVAVAPARAANKIEIDSLSNRPDKITGGDILVRVRVPAGTALDAVTVKLNDADVTGTFWQDTANHALMGLVTGL